MGPLNQPPIDPSESERNAIFGGAGFKANCRTSLLLESVRELCSRGLMETAFDQAYAGLLNISEQGAAAGYARTELAAIALSIHQETTTHRSSIDDDLAKELSSGVERYSQKLSHQRLVIGHSLLAADLLRAGTEGKGYRNRLDAAVTHIILAQRYSEISGDPELKPFGVMSDLFCKIADAVVESKLLDTTVRARREYTHGDVVMAASRVKETLQRCAFIERLDPVKNERAIRARDGMRLLNLFFAHETGDWGSFPHISDKEVKQMRDPWISAGCRLLHISASHQNTQQKRLAQLTPTEVNLFEDFTCNASPGVLILGVTAFHSLALNYLRRGQLDAANKILTPVIEALEWEDLRDHFETHATEMLGTSLYARAQTNFYQRCFLAMKDDLEAGLNLVPEQHSLRAPTEFAEAFLLHCAALRQYWLGLSQANEGPTGEFIQEYEAAKIRLPFLDSGEPLGKIKPWNQYAAEAERTYRDARKHAKSPRLKQQATEGIEALHEFHPPKVNSPFGAV